MLESFERTAAIDESIPVHPDNRVALECFLHCARYWSRAGLAAVPIGLDPVAVRTRLQVMQREHDLDLYDDVMMMGVTAAEVLATRK